MGFVFCPNHGATLGDSQKGAGQTVFYLPVRSCEGFLCCKKLPSPTAVLVVFMGVICTPEDGGGVDPQPISMAVIFPFVLSSVLVILTCWKGEQT